MNRLDKISQTLAERARTWVFYIQDLETRKFRFVKANRFAASMFGYKALNIEERVIGSITESARETTKVCSVLYRGESTYLVIGIYMSVDGKLQCVGNRPDTVSRSINKICDYVLALVRADYCDSEEIPEFTSANGTPRSPCRQFALPGYVHRRSKESVFPKD